MTDINSRLKNYCQQKHLDFIDNSNILEEHLGNRKLHLNKRGNSVLANNFIKYLRSSLQSSSKKLFQWLSDNQMKGNTENCHLIMSTDQSVNFQLGGSLIERSDSEKMLGVKIDYKLIFDEHVKTLCSKVNNKLRALARTTPYMSVEKKKILMNSFFNHSLTTAPLHGCYTALEITVS